MIRETIAFKFENEAQRARFHRRLKAGEDFMLAQNKMDDDWRDLVRQNDELRRALAAEREACAKLADLQAALDRRQAEKHEDVDNSFNDCAITAESIARSIRFRSELSS